MDHFGSWPAGHAIILGRDAEGIEELSGTTEVQRQAGGVKYIPPKDAEHVTDQYRCLMSAVIRYGQMNRGTEDANYDEEFGWAPSGGPEWYAPWASDILNEPISPSFIL